MWSDNAASIDLLGYEDLIDDIVELTLDPNLQPLTLGAFADWGSGKSTLLSLAGARLRDRDALVVEFSPWLVEGYDDVKTCLLSAVLEAVAESEAARTSTGDKVKDLLTSLRGRVNWLRAAKLGASAVIPFASQAISSVETLLSGSGDEPADGLSSSSEVSAGFHREFVDLLNSIDDLGPVVVLVDDLDRCLPPQVIETLEAIRLFLSAPGTAFVIAADERLVRDAVRSRHSLTTQSEVDVPREYLEKLVQIALRIPPLVASDAESYCNLLMSQRRLNEAQFDLVVARAEQIRGGGELTVSCNAGIVRDVIGADEVPAELEEDFAVVARIIVPLAVGLKGNPRQIKRYLNTLSLRRRTADRRGILIEVGVLAKLTVLEYADDDRFRELHRWQADSAGVPDEVTRLENAKGAFKALMADTTVGSWASDPWAQTWIDAEPSVAGVDLTAYFFLSRDRVGSGGAAELLPPALQLLLGRLGDEATAVRDAAIHEAESLGPVDQLTLITACGTKLPGLPDKHPMIRSLLELADSSPALGPPVVSALASLPYPDVPADIPLLVGKRLTTKELEVPVGELLRRWEDQGASAKLSKAAMQARRPSD